MIYLSGCDAAGVAEAGLGLMVQPNSYGASGLNRVRRYKAWAADNGCFSQGDEFNEAAWWRWLWRMKLASPFYCPAARTFCLFATAPDVVCDAASTFRRGYKLMHHLRRHGLPAAFVAQNGLETMDMARRAWFWDELDCLFLGGDDAWKLGPAAAWLAGEALARRKWVHMGRVNSHRRLQHADRIGCHSVDGSFLAYGPAINLDRLRSWLPAIELARAQAPDQLVLPL